MSICRPARCLDSLREALDERRCDVERIVHLDRERHRLCPGWTTPRDGVGGLGTAGVAAFRGSGRVVVVIHGKGSAGP